MFFPKVKGFQSETRSPVALPSNLPNIKGESEMFTIGVWLVYRSSVRIVALFSFHQMSLKMASAFYFDNIAC